MVGSAYLFEDLRHLVEDDGKVHVPRVAAHPDPVEQQEALTEHLLEQVSLLYAHEFETSRRHVSDATEKVQGRACVETGTNLRYLWWS